MNSNVTRRATRTLNSALCAAIVTLAACGSEPTGTDGGADVMSAGDAAISPSDAGGQGLPPTPTAMAGELVITVRDGSTDTTFRCGAGQGTLTAQLRAAARHSLTLVCVIGMPRGDGRQFSLQVSRTAIAPGTFSLSSDHRSATETDQFGVNVTQGGAGFAVGGFASNAPAFTGTLQLDEAVAGAGGRLRGSLRASWTRVGTMTNGTVTGGADRAGGLVGAFDITQ